MIRLYNLHTTAKLVAAHPGSPGLNPESRKTVVVVYFMFVLFVNDKINLTDNYFCLLKFWLWMSCCGILMQCSYSTAMTTALEALFFTCFVMFILYCTMHFTHYIVYFIDKISEEIAFYQGNRKEQAIINSSLLRLVSLVFMIFVVIMSLQWMY